MSVAKIVEITSESPESFHQAIQLGLARAGETLQGIRGAWIKEQSIEIEDGRVAQYRVTMKVTFVLQGQKR